MVYVYVLRSLKDLDLYVGYTADLRQRFMQHQQGENRSTKARKPFELFFYEAHTRSSDARRRESYLKSSKGKAALKMMLRDALSS